VEHVLESSAESDADDVLESSAEELYEELESVEESESKEDVPESSAESDATIGAEELDEELESVEESESKEDASELIVIGRCLLPPMGNTLTFHKLAKAASARHRHGAQ